MRKRNAQSSLMRGIGMRYWGKATTKGQPKPRLCESGYQFQPGADPITPVEVGHRSNSVCLVHHIAMKTGRTIHWDPTREQILGAPAAAAMLGCGAR